MNEEPLETLVPVRAPMIKDVEGQSTEKKSSDTSEAAPTPALEPLAPLDRVETQEPHSSDPVRNPPDEADESDEAASVEPPVEPPVDWFEPLEEDDYDEESLAGESERSESVAGETVFKKVYQFQMPRRKRSHPDEGWDEWPILGEGWKRKEVVRRSGSSIGQKDVYYLSPRGDRVRSRVELISLMEGQLDLSTFDYKSGKFYDGEAQHIRIRHRAKRKVRERSSSESSWMERGEGADTPDSQHMPSPSLGPKSLQFNQTSLSLHSTIGTPNKGSCSEDPPAEDRIKLPLPSSSRALLLPSINGEVGSEESTLVCARCGVSFTGTWYDKQRKRPCCPNCWAASKSKEHPMVRFRKWIPCGQCVGCHNTTNCGQCANCKHGLQSPDSRKRLCRKRKCICPIRKGPGSGGFLPQKPYTDIPDMYDDSMSFQSEFADSQHLSLKSSDTENFSVNVDVDIDDDDDMSTDDDDDWHKKRKRRSCGECKACLCRKDCGTCDFCVDKPKFGGSNKKRQKCRLRQCQRQAMRHLLPYQMGQGDHGPDGQLLPGRPRPHYTYSRKSGFKKSRSQFGLDFTDNEDDDCNLKAINWSTAPASGSKYFYGLDVRNHPPSSQQLNPMDFRLHNGLPDRVPHISSNHINSELDQRSRWEAMKAHVARDSRKHAEEMEDDADDDDDDDDDDDEEEEEDDEEEEEEDDDDEEELPMITQIFSLAADTPSGSGVDIENQLMKLLQSLRSSAMPILWYAIMVEGPQLQLIQCSKQSSLSDTIVLIDPGFCYQVTVQKQPLLPTHALYDRYPARLSSVTEVVSLLLGLEEYVVCQGLPPKEPLSNADPIILERASTCDFLVKRKVSVCTNCRALRGL